MPKPKKPPAGRKTATKQAAKARLAKPAKTPPPTGKIGHRVDWEAVKRDYRTSRFTQVELCRKHKLDQATLSRKIKRDREKDPKAWPQDLSGAVKAATDARLMEQLVKNEVNAGQESVKLTVLAAAELNAQVILAHRARLAKATDVAMRMLGELDQTTLGAEGIQELFETISEDLDGPALAAARGRFGDLMRLHNRVGSVQKLMAALKDAQTLEAQTFNLYDPKKPPTSDAEAMSDEEIDAEIERLQAKRDQA